MGCGSRACLEGRRPYPWSGTNGVGELHLRTLLTTFPTDLALCPQVYAADLSILAGSLPEKAPPPWAVVAKRVWKAANHILDMAPMA